MTQITNIKIKSYRNIDEINISVEKKFLCIYGQNAQGKTNILESIFLMANTRSFRHGSTSDFIKHGERQSFISAKISDEIGSYDLGYKLFDNKKQYFMDNHNLQGIKEIINRFRVISYTPNSSELVLGNEKEKRKFFDRVAYSLDAKHLDDLIYYNKALKNRNTSLKNNQEYRIWDQLIAETGERIIHRREKACLMLDDYVRDAFKIFFRDSEDISLKYCPSVCGDHKEILKALLKNRLNDERRKTTAVGPHRDIFEIKISDKSAKKTISTGQAKLISFLLKLAKSRFIKKFSGINPVFLYDDASAFLDKDRFEQLIDIIKKEDMQIIASSVDMSLFKELFSDSVQMINVKNGSVL